MRIDPNLLHSKKIEETGGRAAAATADPSKNHFAVKAEGVFLERSEGCVIASERPGKKNVAEQAEKVAALDTKTRTDQMIIMAQTMSPQDAAKLSEEGYDLSDMDPSDAVNSLDRMKIKLAEAGVNVAGYTDTVSSEKVEAVTGQNISTKEMAADAVVTAPQTTAAVYGTQSSPTGAEEYFSPDLTEAEVADALISYDLPATEDNVRSVMDAVEMASQLKDVDSGTALFLSSQGAEPTIEAVFHAEFSGAGAKGSQNPSYLRDDMGYVSRAADTAELGELEDQIKEVIERAGFEPDEELIQDANEMIRSGVPLTDRSLQLYEDAKRVDIRPTKREIMDTLAEGKRAGEAYLVADYRNIKALRITKEAALSMSIEAERKMADTEFTIDNEYLKRDVESLKAKEKEAFDLLEETLSVKRDIFDSPVSLAADPDVAAAFMRVGAYDAFRIGEGTPLMDLNGLHEKAVDLSRQFAKAEGTYEAVGTEVRADLGDSIRKAFEATDMKGLLEEAGFEATPQNERAVRIISYAHMELNEENIKTVSETDEKLTDLLEKMTPGRVLRLIRENINPLETDLAKLDARLTEYQDEEDRPVEDFAKFLVSERDKGNMTEDEATSYIGIYRLIHAIDAGDHRAVGALVAQGAEMSFQNLLSAVRTTKKAHIDRYIDENFGGMNAASTGSEQKIDEMIRTAFSPDAGDDGYYEEEAKKFADAAKAEAEIYRLLKEADIKPSADNINAMERLMQSGGNTFMRELAGDASEKTKERIRRARDEVFEAMSEGDADEIKEAYDEMVKTELIGAFEGERMDIRLLQSTKKVMSVRQDLAKREEYHIPMELDGEIISINLKLRHGENRKTVDIYFETEVFGAVSAHINDGENTDISVNCERAAGSEYMSGRKDMISEAVSEVSGRSVNLYIGDKDMTDDRYAMDGTDQEAGGSARLYCIARAALHAMLES